MSACNTLCVSVPHPETSCHAIAGHEVSGCHVHCEESLGEKARVLAVAVHLQTNIERYKSPFLFVPFPFTASLWQVLANVGICCHAAKVLAGFHGQSSSGLRFCKKSSSFPHGRAYLFAKNLTVRTPASLIADETKVTAPTDYAYKKSQHDEKR
jgi:hypothetical protein